VWVQVSKYTDQRSPQQPLNDQSPITDRVVACKSKKKVRRVMMNDYLFNYLSNECDMFLPSILN